MKEDISYEAAVKQLENIVAQLENDELGIDKMTEQIKTAQKLLKLCKDKLTKAEKEVDEILKDDKE
jgi:exodeoxyribonuclease VII small subunit